MSDSTADRIAALSSEQRVRLLRRLLDAGRISSLPAVVPPRDPTVPVPLSPAQQDLWVFESLYPNTAAINLCCSYHFDRPVDPADLEAALTIVQDHHDVLRTVIGGTPGDLTVSFPHTGPFTLERVDLRGATTTLAEVVSEFRARPFDLGRDRLVRGRFVVVDDERSVLLLALHHIVTDWWSFDVLHAEFARAYRAVRAGTASGLTRPAIQYADFACWQRDLERAGVLDAQLAFWRDYLRRPPAPLAVGPAATTATAAGFDVEQVRFDVDARLAAAVRAFARDRRVTVYAVLISAFAVFAYRLSGADDLVLGTPVANRAARGLERVVGYVMNVLPTRWRIRPTDSYAQVLAGFAASFPDLLANAAVPVGRIVADLDPERVAGRSPLFQWVFMYLPVQDSVRALREVTRPERIHTGGEHDVVAILRDTDEGVAGSFEVRTGVYPPAVVRRWADSFLVLLERLLADPHAPVADHDLLAAAERHRLVVTGNDTAEDLPPSSLADLVARWARQTPAAVAVESDGLVLTYAELDRRVARLADLLTRRGVGPERLVAVAAGRSVWTVLAALAVQRAGGAYLPVDPDHPAERIAFVLGDAAPVLVLTDAATAPRLPDTDVPRLLVDALPGEHPVRRDGGDAPADPPVPFGRTDPSNAAYVQYTSGSTGRPKGVVVTHAGVASLAATLVRRLELGTASRVLQLGSPAFDISVAEMCMAFGAGGTLVVPPAGPLVGDGLAAVLADRGITAAILPPTILATVPPGPYPALRSLCVGAEACPAETVATWSPGRRMVNAYGPTEATVALTVSDPLTAAGGAPPIGRPVANARLYVLDAALRPVPVGVVGELYAAGPALARGYLNGPGPTAQRFVADPFGPPGGRMYRTGDLVRRLADGQLDFVGRTDDQIALHGLRIEPGEVEAVLAGHETVAQVAVQARAATPAGGRGRGERRLVAYVVARPGARVDPDALRAHAAAVLPHHMVPAAFVVLDRMPRTPGGKLDRAALPAPVLPAPVGRRPPRTPVEAALCALFAEVLGRPEIGADDDFFDLGGDSIAAIQMVGRAAASGLGLAARDVLTTRTPAGLAALVRTVGVGEPAAGDPGVGRFPPTPVVHWWREQGGPLDAFTQSGLFPLPAGTGRQRVTEAVQALLDRHGALRLRLLCHSATDWELEVPPAGSVRADDVLSRTDARGTEPAAVRAAAGAAAATTRLAPEAGDTVRAVWFDAGTERPGWLLLTVHHLAVDAVSWRILGDDLAALLRGAGPEPPPGTSLPAWSRFLRQEARDPARTAELGLWKRMVTGADAGLGCAPAGPGRPRRVLTVDLPPPRTGPLLTDVTAAFHCGPQEVLLTALAAAVVRWRGDPAEVLVDVEGHGRGAGRGVDLSRTVGWFTTQYPLRIGLGEADPDLFWQGGGETGETLKRVKEQVRAVPDGGVGFGLLRYLNPDTAAELAGAAAPQLRFNYLGRTAAGDRAGVELLGGPAEAVAGHPVELDAVTEDRDDGPHLVATWSWWEDALGADRVRDLARLWFDALGVLAEHASTGGAGGFTESDFPLVDLTRAQLDALGADWGDVP